VLGFTKSAAAKIRTLVDPTRATKCRRKFLRFFPKGFADDKYWHWERGYKWRAHERWNELLSKAEFEELLKAGHHAEIGSRAMRSLSGTNLLFSFESMALRDALKTPEGSTAFAAGLYEFLYGKGPASSKFDAWCDTVASLPKKQSRVLTHPISTVFGFLAKPKKHIFLKPTVTKRAAEAYGFDFRYSSRPSWATYSSLLDFAGVISDDLADLEPRDMIDIQSFIWVMGSDEYR
jgi:hypothetical protein